MLFSGSLFSYLSDKANNKCSSSIFYFISFIFVISALIFRYNVGTDYNSYEYIYYNVKSTEEYLEPGFLFLLRICNYFSLSSSVFISLFSIISTSFIYLTARHYNKLLFITFYILVLYFQNMTAIRQITAVCIALYAVHFLINKKIVYFIFWIYISSLFHSSTLLLLPFCIFNYIRCNRTLYLPIFLILFIFISYIDIFQLIDNLQILQNTKYQNYIYSKFNTPTQLGSGLGVILKMILPIIFIIYSINKKDHKANIIFILSVSYLLSIILSAKIHIFNRLPPIFCIIIPFALFFYKNKKISYPKYGTYNVYTFRSL
ncbi:EpsG family protein [Morganella psychrotolerans]|uniref:EpsG family protein n=1 Tax=Morganella psychrotolerans TaxID=368603 RepID=UPI000AD167AA